MRKLTTEEFVEKAKCVHGDIYNYDSVQYNGSKIRVELICEKHGLFMQKPNHHLLGSGCPKCANNITGTTEDFVQKSILLHGNSYDYSQVCYVNSDTKVSIKCLKCSKVFYQKPNKHLQGRGCNNCYTTKKRTKFQFLSIVKSVHGGRYDYSLVVYKNQRTNVTVICSKHGKFSITPKHHINGVGCKLCNMSKGELKIEKYLKSRNISYENQKFIDGCVNVKKLLFDFYIPSINMCIEYDGEHHFKPINWSGDMDEDEMNYKYKNIINNDNIKNKFCVENGIRLIRIPYTKFKSIDTILDSEI
jgi:very-short-patch-repair endonuclease